MISNQLLSRVIISIASGVIVSAGITGCNLLDGGNGNLSCPRVSLQGEEVYWGEVTAIQNDEPWPADSWDSRLYAVMDEERDVFDILIDISKLGESYQEHLHFAGIPNRTGVYALPGIYIGNEEQMAFFFTIIGGDVLGDAYYLDRSAGANRITIDALNASNCSVEGSFELTAIRDTTYRLVPVYPDTIRFSEGYFRTHRVL